MTENELKSFGRLVGTWATEATHPMLPGVVVQGTAEIEWLEGQRFLVQRSRMDHPDFPNAISVIGYMDQERVSEAARKAETPLSMHYFDERGVFRIYDASLDETAWRLRREAPGFSQRFEGKFVDKGHTISGLWQLCQDNVQWHDDLRITYKRVA